MDNATKVLIIGARGMLGQMLIQTFSECTVTAWDKDEIDITNAEGTLQKIQELCPSIIINAAAYTAVDDCETNRDIAMRVNGDGPGNLAEAARAVDAILVHYSTDYIFDGTRQTGYTEKYTEVAPINVYGESKAAGEQAIHNIAKEGDWTKYYIVRTAWLYGPGGKNFVDTMISLSQTKDTLSVVNDQHGSPTYTKDLAKRTLLMLQERVPFGIYHVTNSGTCTWYEFTQEIFRIKDITIELRPCTTAEFPRPAQRPAWSVLVNTKLAPMRSWQDALLEYLSIEQ